MICQTTRWILLLGVLLLNRPAFAQNAAENRKKLDQAAFQLIKTTVEFLTTDTQTFQHVKANRCQCDSYDGLKDFITQNELIGADKLVDEARRRAAQNIAQINQPRTALEGVKDYLNQKVASGDRASRQNLPTYAAFESAMDGIINRALTTGSAVAAPEQTVDTPEAATPTATSETAEPAPVATPSNTQSNSNSMDSFALFLSILSLVGVAFLAYLVVKNQKPQQSARDVQFDSQLAKLSDRISKLEVRKNQTNETFQLNAQLEALERSVRLLEQNRTEKPAAPTARVPLEVVKPAVQEAPDEPEVPNRPANRFRTPTVEPARPTALFARTADLGDGFSAGGLLTTPERDTVFDITIQSDTQATYQVSENADAQRLALSDPYSYLNDACEYLTQPNPNSRIRTEQPGQLTLQGDKWKITEKAKIRFI
ncbi:hypothetical protein GCM10028803_43970 [Larkinella knui]|uniref:Uncharacterized protein n=1 Tax=Larkinella knui TaxID=2025310 RepID=A0A3P1CNW5_9BACT|nr:hypothetical protein [Larkinella knui]RRB15013.1 hypothetical protein EHT87_10670 [Larkinella knui]